jgi:hypothetical protein
MNMVVQKKKTAPRRWTISSPKRVGGMRGKSFSLMLNVVSGADGLLTLLTVETIVERVLVPNAYRNAKGAY